MLRIDCITIERLFSTCSDCWLKVFYCKTSLICIQVYSWITNKLRYTFYWARIQIYNKLQQIPWEKLQSYGGRWAVRYFFWNAILVHNGTMNKSPYIVCFNKTALGGAVLMKHKNKVKVQLDIYSSQKFAF